MQHPIYNLLSNQPLLVLFLILGLGLLVGKIRIGGVELGAVTGVLVVGLVAGHFDLPIPTASHNIGFIIFIYAVGVQAGPRFFGAFKHDGGKYFLLAVITAISATAIAHLFAGILKLELGYAAGMLSGALTSSPTLVAARDAVSQGLNLPQGLTPEAVLDNISAAYAITYVFGMAGLILFISFMPRIFRIDMREEARRLGEEEWVARGKDPDEYLRVGETPSVRAYRVENEKAVGVTAEEADYQLPGTIQRVKRGTEVFTPDDESTLELGDVITVIGTSSVHKFVREEIGPEVLDQDILDRSVETMTIIVSNKHVEGKTLHEMDFGNKYQCWLTRFSRAGENLPRRPDMKLRIGDVLVATGPRSQLEAMAEQLGFKQKRMIETDLVTFAFGIALGLLFGIPTVTIGGTSVGLGSAGGVLLAGLLFGLLHSRRVTFGRLPSAARFVLMEIGLLMFMASVAVDAGGTIVETFRQLGPRLAVCGAVVTIVPVLLCFFIGRYWMRMNAALLLGAITGSMTSTAALRQVNSRAKSTLPMLGYVGTYAFANVLLTVAGGVIMRM